MALKSFQFGLQMWPGDILCDRVSIINGLIDATGEAQASLFRSPITGTITAIKFRFGAITTGDILSAELQTCLSATATPSDTIFAAGAGNSFSATTTMANTWQTVTLATPCEVAINDKIACVVKRADSGGAGNLIITALSSNAVMSFCGAGKAISWGASLQVRNILPIYSGTAIASAAWFAPWQIASPNMSAGATPDEVGNIIAFPFRCRTNGYYFNNNATISVGTVMKFRLYNTDGTSTLATSTIAHKSDLGVIAGYFNTSVILEANSSYRISAFVSTGATSVSHLSLADATANGMMALGSLCYATSRTDLGAWSDNTAARYGIGLMLDQFDDSSASGGTGSGLAHIIGGGM